MSRVIEPLREIGARVDGRDRGTLAPNLYLEGGKIKNFLELTKISFPNSKLPAPGLKILGTLNFLGILLKRHY